MTDTHTSLREVQSLALQPTDYLGIDFDGTKFHLRCRSLTQDPTMRKVGSDRYVVDGEVFFDSWVDPSVQASSFFTSSKLVECDWSAKLGRYLAAATDTTAVIISRSWGKRLIFVSSEAKEIFNALLEEFAQGDGIAEQVAAFKLEGKEPRLHALWRERADRRLAPYQRVAVTLSLGTRAFALFMDRGTGKTPCAVQRVCMEALMTDAGELPGGVQRKDGGKMMRVLVAVPTQVRLNWQREFDKFATVKGKVSVLRGELHTRVKRIAEMIAPEDGMLFSATIVGYDTLARTCDYLSLLEWDLVVCDESHNYKDPRTGRWGHMQTIRDSSKRRLTLTGTPIGNSPMDLWSQLEFLRKGGSGFLAFKHFKGFHGIYEENSGGYGVSKLIGVKNIPLLQERLSKMSFSVTKEEAGLNLPDKVRSITEIQMGEYQADVYNRLQAQLAIEIEDKLSGDIVDEVTVNNVLTMLLRLAQVTSGFITYDAKLDEDGKVISPKRLEELSPDNPKVNAVIERLADPDRDPKAKAIVWCAFVHNIHRVGAELTKHGIKHGLYYGQTSQNDRELLVDAFNNDPEFKVLVCNTQTAGEGLNLLGYDTNNPETSPTYCDLEIFVSSNWSAIQRAQGEDRAHRRGTRMPVEIVDLIVPGTIDEEIMDRVTSKREMANAVADLRITLDAVLKRRVSQ